MRIFVGTASDVGKVRETNEDSLLIDVEQGLFAVADGMGGARAGEVASRLALEELHRVICEATVAPNEHVMRDAIVRASDRVVEEARANAAAEGMGTTLTALWLTDDAAILGHVGDSRLYRVRWGRVEQLTQDDTAVAEMVKAGAITAEQAPTHPWASILTQVVGRADPLDVETAVLDVEAGDRFLICSDGFSDSLTDPEWLSLLSRVSPDDSAQELVARAVELDGKDNATAVVVALGDDETRGGRRTSWTNLRERVSGFLQRSPKET